MTTRTGSKKAMFRNNELYTFIGEHRSLTKPAIIIIIN